MDDKFFLTMIDKFSSAAIAELEFSDGTTRLVLRKESASAVYAGGESRPLVSAAGTHKQDTQDPAGMTAAVPADRETAESARPGISAAGGEKIQSPIVATFYASPSPDSPPFVKPGSKVAAGQTLCILEAMKMMNHLDAEFDCEIIETHISSGELVEYGQDLFTVKRCQGADIAE